MTRYAVTISSIAVAIFLCVMPASAWEFELEAGFSWNYYAGFQMGNEGFFGPWNVDAAGTANQNQNFWTGANKWPGVYPGKNVSVQTQYAELAPVFIVNEAISLSGTYYIGSWEIEEGEFGRGALVASEYRNSSATGTGFSFSPGYWNDFSLEAETPWGVLSMGKRAFAFGLGALASGEDVTTTDSIQLTVPYGPLSIGILWFPSRFADESIPLDTLSGGLPTADTGVFIQTENGATLRDPQISLFAKYSACNVEMGYLLDTFRWSLGPESVIVDDNGGTTGRAAARGRFIPRDLDSQMHILYAKYFSGRVFFNAEVDFWNSLVRNKRNLDNTDEAGGSPNVGGIAGAGSAFQAQHTEAQRYTVEAGSVLGPAKVTLLWSWASGFDRRHGVLIDKQGAGLWLGPRNTGDNLLTLHPNFANTILYNPYNYLMVFNYGGGNNAFNRNGDGFLVDANLYAARFDYSLAANMNAWASFLYADRVSHGYGWGYITPNMAVDVDYARQGDFNNPAPAIPDSNLGWEINAGLDWMLLEGLIFAGRVSYWQPGKWFSYACTSRANPGWNAPTAANNFGVVPGREIDAVMGMEIALGAEF
jgi:hypothetical protein